MPADCSAAGRERPHWLCDSRIHALHGSLPQVGAHTHPSLWGIRGACVCVPVFVCVVCLCAGGACACVRVRGCLCVCGGCLCAGWW